MLSSGGAASATRLFFVQLRPRKPVLLRRRRLSSSFSSEDFRPRKALVLSKVTRYEFEKRRLGPENNDESEFERALTSRGSDYTSIRFHHNIHTFAEAEIVQALESKGVETRVVKRYDYDTAAVDWADVIFTAGGDGTYLMAASKIPDRRKPLIGINTDPTRSEGYLLLPKHFSYDIRRAIEMILGGKFYWFFRRRLRITLIGSPSAINEPPIELYNQQLTYPEYRFVDLLTESFAQGDHPFKVKKTPDDGDEKLARRRLPVLALNEVFVGESLSSRVSYLEVKFDEEPPFKTRNSGLCISTGTGSTSWTFNINKLTHQAVENLMRIVFQTTHFPIDYRDKNLIASVTRRFNNDLIFDPECNMMVYTLRDPVSVGTIPDKNERKPRGLARKIEVKSKCFDACLVIDGSLSFKFDDGMRAIIETFDKDALRTVQIYTGANSSS